MLGKCDTRDCPAALQTGWCAQGLRHCEAVRRVLCTLTWTQTLPESTQFFASYIFQQHEIYSHLAHALFLDPLQSSSIPVHCRGWKIKKQLIYRVFKISIVQDPQGRRPREGLALGAAFCVYEELPLQASVNSCGWFAWGQIRNESELVENPTTKVISNNREAIIRALELSKTKRSFIKRGLGPDPKALMCHLLQSQPYLVTSFWSICVAQAKEHCHPWWKFLY